MAEYEQSKNWRLHSGDYLGEISALCFLHPPRHLSSLPFLLAGTGSQLLLYSLEVGKIIQSFQVFQGIRVHGITCCTFTTSGETQDSFFSFEIAVFGEKKVKFFKLSLSLSSKNQLPDSVELSLVHSLPKFSHWVLDISVLKCASCPNEKESVFLAIGCSDNSVHLWDVSTSTLVIEVQSPDKSLLYSMRLWGENLESLRIASGTIYNEIIVWKVVLQGPQQGAPPSISPLEGDICFNNSFPKSFQLHLFQWKAAHICRLIGHEGSIFRIVWSSDGSKLVSVSDDRSARIWEVAVEQSDKPEEMVAGSVLYGHNARVWDCCVSDSLIVTAGEDCTCRVWRMDGKQVKMIREHIGRGVWRCLYDPSSSLLITAGFDSAVKVHQLPASLSRGWREQNEPKQFFDRTEILSSRIPNSSEHIGLTDSKSEYVRCLRFTSDDALYVATNHGYLYHAKFFVTQEAKWTKLLQVNDQVPIVCMDLLSMNVSKCSGRVDDWIALGDGKGNLTVVRIIGDVCTAQVDFIFTWSAGKERQLLGTYWCKALGCRFIFTADPRGFLKLWSLHDPLLPVSHPSVRSSNVSLLATFKSSFGFRIMCLDASLEDEVLVCGDLRGNLVLFPLSKSLLMDTPASETIISPMSSFEGVHGISSVSSISVAKLSSNETEIRSTGGDGCICYLEYGQDAQNLEFIGMKQVKELSLIQSVSASSKSSNDLSNCGYAVGFASTDFIIWNLITETKVVQIPCGGWRRPHSYYLGDLPEVQSCFAYVKDEVIFVHRQCTPENERKIFPQNFHIQFHGREMHSLCFIYESTLVEANGKHGMSDKSSWVATGCEDGTVRLTRYIPGVESWFESKLLGEHVGGSAVRSICCVSKVHWIASDVVKMFDSRSQNASAGDSENPFLLISVGAKRVLTSWLLRTRKQNEEESILDQEKEINENGQFSSPSASSSMSFKWLSTDMPAKRSNSCRITRSSEKLGGMTENVVSTKTNLESKSILPVEAEGKVTSCLDDKCEDDWRYLAVTAFLVRCIGSRLNICFVVVSCSDASLALRALVLPHRLWFDVASLIPVSSPVLALQHVIIPTHLFCEENAQIGNAYIVISGATDGSICFWDLTDSVEAFAQQLSAFNIGSLINCQKRPRTGRGSQGGRWWKSLASNLSKKGSGNGALTIKSEEETDSNLVNAAFGTSKTVRGVESCSTETISSNSCEKEPNLDALSPTICSGAVHDSSLEHSVHNVDSLPGTCEIQPLHVFNNVHQSGVNCLHVSDIHNSEAPDSSFLFSLVSGGDDQAIHCLEFDVSPVSKARDSSVVTPEVKCSLTKSEDVKDNFWSSQSQNKNFRIRFLHRDRVTSAHSSAVKGIWTDGTWVFSTGLDQRIRCWLRKDNEKLTEQAYLIISVPEPEALHARACSGNYYEIAVAGRGMQMVKFCVSDIIV